LLGVLRNVGYIAATAYDTSGNESSFANEVRYGLSKIDMDGNGVNDGAEVKQGTDPKTPSSALPQNLPEIPRKQMQVVSVGSEELKGGMALGALHHPREPRVSLGRLTRLEDAAQVPNQRVSVAWPTAVEQRPGRQLKRSSQIVLLMLTWSYDGPWRACGPLRTPHLGPQVHIACVRTY
jgi:hypothetical protein